MRISFGAKVNLAFIAGLVLHVAVGFFAFQSIDDLIETSRAEGRAFDAMEQIGRLLGSLEKAESVQRRYLTTGNNDALVEYDSLRSLIFAEITALRGRKLDFGQLRRLDNLREAVTEHFDLLAPAVQAKQAGRRNAAAIAAPHRRELARRIQQLAGEFNEQEWRTLLRRQADVAYSAGATSFMIVWGGILAMLLLFWAMLVINRYYAERNAGEAALRASEAQMRLVTDAMPAMIAYLDTDERFHFHNKAFEGWFDQPAQAFDGKTLRELVGKETYATLQPHLAGALAGKEVRFDFTHSARQGKVLDLAAHLVPQRDHRGKVTGVFVLVTDITDLKRLERLKAEFVATVSHELRTPLTSIRGSLGLLAGGAVGVIPETAKNLLNIATDNCERLVRLVNDILDVEKTEAGKMPFSLQALDLGELVAQSVKANEGFAVAHNVTVRIVNRASGVMVHADGDRLGQVMANLLSNACKFSPPGATVDVAVSRRDGMAAVSVRDRGPGIPEEFQSRIFERFAQADSSNTRGKGGTGLGLAISRTIIERMGGRIGFERGEDGGAAFVFSLPEWRPLSQPT